MFSGGIGADEETESSNRVLEDVQVLVAETGWIPGEQDPSPETEPRRTDIKPSLCTFPISTLKQDLEENFVLKFLRDFLPSFFE